MDLREIQLLIGTCGVVSALVFGASGVVQSARWVTLSASLRSLSSARSVHHDQTGTPEFGVNITPRLQTT